MADVRLF